MLESITGFLTEMENATASNLASEPIDTAVWVVLAILLGWLVLFGITYLVLAIISCVKQKLSLSSLLEKTFGSFKNLYKPMLKYYIPAIILSFIVGIINLVADIFRIFGDPTTDAMGGYILLILILSPFIIAYAIYISVLDNSLAKSYYASLKGKKFSFSWISFGEFFKLIWVGLLYFLLMIASLFLLGIPLLFLPAISLFLRFPILNEGKRAGETIGKAIDMLKKDFWNIFFFYFIYSLMVGFASGLAQVIPILGYVAVVVIVTPISTLLSAEAYYYLNKNYEQNLKKAK